MADNVLGSLFQSIADAIRNKTGGTRKIIPADFPDEINSIVVGAGGGLSSDERVKYVTFMDGATELLKYPVIAGDTCKNPVTTGFISTPTKESTVQYDYTHNGWSLNDGGSASASALTNVTEDRVVYAAFAQSARKYTITYYDEDGVTVLKTEQVAYGTVPSYIPTKEGVAFNKWTPTPVAVTGDASYTASFIQTVVVMDWSGTIVSSSLSHGLYSTVTAFSYAEGDTFIAEVDGVSYTTTVFKVNVSYSSTSGQSGYYVVGDPYKWLNSKGEKPTVRYADTNATFPNNYSSLPFCCQFYSYSSKTDVSFNFTSNGAHTIKLMKVF